MDRKSFTLCIAEIPAYADRDSYISDMALSPLWGDDPDTDIPQKRIDELGQVWEAANRSTKEIAVAAGLSQRKLAERFMIPYRTMEDWCRGARECPIYVRLMMQECLGILPLQNERD